MKSKILSLLFGVFLMTGAVFGADKIAVAQPTAKAGIPQTEAESLWGQLESLIDGNYEVVSRSALKQMLTEIGLTENSNLTELNSIQAAKSGQLKTVKYILISTLSKTGTRGILSMMVMDASTGAIRKEQRGTWSFTDFSDLADQLPDMLKEIGLGGTARKYGFSVLLEPLTRQSGMTAALAGDFNAQLENALLENGIRLRNLQAAQKLLAKNGIGPLNETDPAMYMRIGKLLRADQLAIVCINRFECTSKKKYVQVTRRYVEKKIGRLEGFIRVISASNGEIKGSIPFRVKQDFADLDDTEDWTSQDYAKFLLEKAVSQISKPLTKVLK